MNSLLISCYSFYLWIVFSLFKYCLSIGRYYFFSDAFFFWAYLLTICQPVHAAIRPGDSCDIRPAYGASLISRVITIWSVEKDNCLLLILAIRFSRYLHTKPTAGKYNLLYHLQPDRVAVVIGYITLCPHKSWYDNKDCSSVSAFIISLISHALM